jgi:hypothetical protein
MKPTTCTSLIALMAGSVVMPVSSHAASTVQAKFIYDGLVTCANPSVRDLPVHIEGTGTLSVDRHASIDVEGSSMGIVGKREHTDATLGGRPVAAENGSASVRVMGRSHLQAVRSFPNNSVIADIFVSGKSCTLTVSHRLNRGKREYTFPSPLGGLAYCERPRTVRTSCQPI